MLLISDVNQPKSDDALIGGRIGPEMSGSGTNPGRHEAPSSSLMLSFTALRKRSLHLR
jgi:hypothetical protein